ncbi:MAG: glutathione S-transferase family protein [Proteobacteria bacterium]|nr:glutathione S-transferase family protein [Pseudomonadota bacterium]
MDTLDLYGFGVGDRSSKVRWLCHELGLPIQEHKLGFGEHRKPPYTDLNPYGMVPTAQWRGETLTESTATCTWLAEQHPESGLVIAPGEPDRYAYLRWVALFAETLESRLVEYVVAGFGAVAPVFRETTEPRLRHQLPIMVSELPSEGFLVGGRMTLADIEAGYSLRLAIGAELLSIDDVAGYLRPLMARPAAKAAQFFSSIEG